MRILNKYQPEDLVFTIHKKWGLKKFNCNVWLFTEEPLNDLFYVICSILNLEDGCYDKRSLALLLGFNVVDDFYNTNVRYFDVAEERLFDDILQRVEQEHLIRIEDDQIVLTELGKISIKEGIHYRFYKGKQSIYEHLRIESKMPMALQMFPFYDDMGIYTTLEIEQNHFWPSDDYVESIIYHKTSPIIKRIEKQSKEKVNIYEAKIDELFELDSQSVQINLYCKNDVYYPVIMKSVEEAAKKATSLIHNGLNETLKENIILECLFQKLWSDPNSVLNYSNLKQFIDFIDFEKLALDERTVWKDSKLTALIFEQATQNCWRAISLRCDERILCKNIDDIKEKLDWQIFSERVNDKFLMDNFIQYPWDLESISCDKNRNIKTIEYLICLNKDTEEEDWDWQELNDRLSDDFILSHLDIVDVDLSRFTEDTPEIRSAVLKNIDKRWDWNKVEETFSLDFIGDHILEIGKHFSCTVLFERIFTSPVWSKEFINKISFKTFLSNETSENGILSDMVLNNKNFIWSDDKVVKLLLDYKLIYWESTPYMNGFECNPFIIWSKNNFKKYSKYISSDKGYNQVSKSIEDVSILVEYPSFPWNWDLISSNQYLIDKVDLYDLFGDKLNWVILFQNKGNQTVFEKVVAIDSKIGDNKDAWTSFSQIASIEYIKSHYKYNWNWQLLTERMFQSLKLEHLGHREFVNKWDWTYLSKNVPTEFLSANLQLHALHWDWSVVLERLFRDDDEIAQSQLDNIVGIISTISEIDIRKKAWTALTHLFTLDELLLLIPKTIRQPNYEWDMKVFSSLDEFRIGVHLPKCYKFIDWEALSTSSAAKRAFTYVQKSAKQPEAWRKDTMDILDNPNYHWDFKALSNIPYLQNQLWFISKYRNHIDWKIISRCSSLFSETDKQKLNELIDNFKDGFLDFNELSQREDVDIEQIITICPNEDYDFNSLIENGILEPKIQFIIDKPNYDWDYYMISTHKLFDPDKDFLLQHIDEHFNWGALSSQDYPNIWSDEIIILSVSLRENIRSEINWYALSSRTYFPIKRELMESIPKEKLNWAVLSQSDKIIDLLDSVESFVNWKMISSNPRFDVSKDDTLERYKDFLDWHQVCQRQDFKITNSIIEKFGDYIDWTIASQSTLISFSVELVNKYADKWNWNILVKNKAFYNYVDVSVLPQVSKLNIIEFMQQFPRKPKAYHFTHLSNAVKIIKSMKLQSRNYADGKFDDSAGSKVVSRTDKAHGFARFYFVPHSPTQFYNEFLGKSSKDRYYQRAIDLGLPKCPIPIFFVFDVEELLMKMPMLCYYSNGNMQKAATRSFKIIESPNHICAKEIYINSKETMHQRQQEFLIEGELDFSSLNNVQICCFDELHKHLLIEALGDTSWSDRIIVNSGLYDNCNKKLEFVESEDELMIRTDYPDEYLFRISYDGKDVPTILNEDQIVQQKQRNIYMRNQLRISKSSRFEVYFEVKQPRHGSWLIYNSI